jgi:hypothetical protein
MQRAIDLWMAACPRSGCRPGNEEEWERVLRACEELVYAGLVAEGYDPVITRAAIRNLHRKPGVRVFMDVIFDELEAIQNAAKF